MNKSKLLISVLSLSLIGGGIGGTHAFASTLKDQKVGHKTSVTTETKEQEYNRLYKRGVNSFKKYESVKEYKIKEDPYYISIIHELTTTEEIDFYWDLRDELLLEAEQYYKNPSFYTQSRAFYKVGKSWLGLYQSYNEYVIAITMRYKEITKGITDAKDMDYMGTQLTKLMIEARAYYFNEIIEQ